MSGEEVLRPVVHLDVALFKVVSIRAAVDLDSRLEGLVEEEIVPLETSTSRILESEHCEGRCDPSVGFEVVTCIGCYLDHKKPGRRWSSRTVLRYDGWSGGPA